jgi:hypothetical protein
MIRQGSTFNMVKDASGSAPSKTGRHSNARNSLQRLKMYHKWPALVISLFLLLFALSGVVLNHRSFFSRAEVNRKWLPSEYRYSNWNLAAVKSSLRISPDSVLVYGNIGIWLTDSSYTMYTSFNEGIAKGIDNRKVSTMLHTSGGQIFAGTLSGLYKLDTQTGTWTYTALPVRENRIVGMAQKGDSLYLMTRSEILVSADSPTPGFTIKNLPPAADDQGTETLFRTLWVVHSGKIFGTFGQIFVDLMALVLVILILSGLFYFFTPGILKKISNVSLRSGWKKANRFSLKWHNTLGYITFIFLGIIALTGMFLRPPLLIPIVRTTVPVIKNTWLDNPNPWFDKLRDILWDADRSIFLYSTSRGIYYSGGQPSGTLTPFPSQPPVSVMGVNVFDKAAPGEYLVGSFSGMYLWIPEKDIVTDYLTGLDFTGGDGLSSPFGNVPVSGRLDFMGNEILFDYTRGAFSPRGEREFGAMPDNILLDSPLSLWNLALEVHTGRIFFPLIGNFYILYIPVMGISTLVVLVSGLLIWWKKRKK